MPRKRFKNEQIAFALRQAENGTAVEEICRKLYRTRRDAQTELRMRLKELAATPVRYDYRRLHILLQREGWPVNHKRTYRLYREGRPVDPREVAETEAGLALSSGPAGGRRAERGLGHGLHSRSAVRRPSRE